MKIDEIETSGDLDRFAEQLIATHDGDALCESFSNIIDRIRDKPVRSPCEEVVLHTHVDTPVVSGCQTLQEARKRKRGRVHPSRRLDPPQEARCRYCGCADMVDDYKHGDLVCTDCGTCTPNSITEEAFKNMSYEEYGNTGQPRNNFYKKDTYFACLLSQLIGRQSANIPPHVYAEVLKHAPKEESLNGKSVKKALKKAGMGKFYDHCYLIANHLTRNASLIHVSHIEEDILHGMFKKIQNLFDSPVGDSFRGVRKNSLNYNYIIWQCFVLLGREDVCQFLDMLKCKRRLQRHDDIWRIMCLHLDWEYVPIIIRKVRSS